MVKHYQKRMFCFKAQKLAEAVELAERSAMEVERSQREAAKIHEAKMVNIHAIRGYTWLLRMILRIACVAG